MSRQYKVRDDGESGGRDYSDYYGDEPQGAEQDEKASAGFVEPIDFSSFFTAGFGGAAAGSSKIDSFFRPQGAELNAFSLGSAFPGELQASATTNNETGFISPQVKFQSHFDADSSASVVGFRPQDFLQRSSDADDDGVTQESAPFDFSSTFASDDDDFASTARPRVFPTKAYEPRTYSNNKQSAKQGPSGKSSYPAPSRYPANTAYGGPTPVPLSYYANTPANKPLTTYSPLPSKPTASLPYDAYPSKSASTYNPTGPYLSKPGYKTADKPTYKAYPTPTYDSKSVYPKKATEFYPTKIGQRPTASSFRPTPAQSQLSPLYQYSASVPEEGRARYIAPQDYYKFGPSVDEEEAESRTSDDAPYVTTRVPTPERKSAQYVTARSPAPVKRPTSDPYSPSEYGKEDDYRIAEPADNEEIKVNPADDKKNCKKIEKKLSKDAFTHGRFRRDAMTCYACNNPKTGGSFEKCVYDSFPEGSEQQYFHGHATVFSDKPMQHRRKRRDARVTRQQPSSDYGQSYEDYISKFSRPDKKDYQYEPEQYTPVEYDDAEYKAAPTKDADQNCKTVTKGTMTCSVCQNAKTGGQSEQCSYATSPKENNYFVARQSSFNSKKPRKGESRQSRQEPHTANYGANDGTTAAYHTRKSIKPYDFSTEVAAAVTKKGSYKGPLDGRQSRYSKRESDDYDEYGSAPHYGSEEKESKKGYAPLDHYGGDHHGKQADRRSDESKQEPKYHYGTSKSYDEHFRELFPELAGQESQNSRSDKRSDSDSDDYDDAPQSREADNQDNPGAVDYYKAAPAYNYPDIEQKKDLEKVLGEFSQKDRSDCKKVVRDKMTCYQCVDKKGMQHEECMFVAASQPKSQHLAYHELKEFRLPGLF